MAPRHDYDLRVSASTLSYEVADNIKPVTVSLESDELVVPHEEVDVTLDKLKDFVFVDENEDEDPEYVESSAESEDSLEFETEALTRDYDLRAPGISPSFDGVNDLKPVTVKVEWDQLIVPHEEGDVTLDKLNEFVFEEEEDEEDPEYEESCVESDDSLEYESEVDSEVDDSEDDDYCSDELTSMDPLASFVVKSCSDFLESNDISWSSTSKAKEYFASFGSAQLGIKLADLGLSLVETPTSYFSSWMSDSVRKTRRNLRAVRRAGEKINDSCKSRSLLVHMANLFPMNAVLDSLGVALVEETLYQSVNKHNVCVVDEDIEDDPEYVESSDGTDDSLEFKSVIDSDENVVSDVACSELEETSGGEEVASSELDESSGGEEVVESEDEGLVE